MIATMDHETRESRLVPAACIYLGGLLIGLTLVSFPASSLVLRSLHHLSNEQYGAIYIPQLAASVIGALAGGALARSFSLRAMFLAALACFFAAELCLGMSAFVGPDLALGLIMAGTAAFGFGFGFGGGPLNAFAALLFPERHGAAVTAVHMCAGAGLTVAPMLFALLADEGLWIAGPAALAIGALVLLVVSASTNLPSPPAAAPVAIGQARVAHPGRTLFFWICALASLLYSAAEGTFSNWAIVFLTDERGIDPASAALSLTCFWASVTAGRLIATLVGGRLPPLAFLIGLTGAMALSMASLPGITGAQSAYVHFALAGLTCSAFFPMLVAFTASRTPGEISWIASMLTAAMMTGVGIGSYAVGALRGGIPIAQLYRLAVAVPLLCLVCVLLCALLRARRTTA